MKARLIAMTILVGSVALACTRTESIDLPSPDTASDAAPPAPVSTQPDLPVNTNTDEPGQETAPTEDPNTAGSDTIAGQADGTVKGVGDQEMSLSFNQMDPYSYWLGPKGYSALTFLNGPNGLTLGGNLRKGTHTTSNEVSLQLSLIGEDPVDFISGNGSCTITVDDASMARVSGSFNCDHAKIDKGTFIDLSGTFSSDAPVA